jgi:hypothetical protein
MTDTSLTEAELRVEFLNISHAALAELCAELVCKLRAARVDLEQAARDYEWIIAVAGRGSALLDKTDWLKRVREREGKNAVADVD